MLIELGALVKEISAIKCLSVSKLCECLAMAGFPVDAIDSCSGTTVFEVDVTANRGDVLSHRGLARDLAAVLDAQLSAVEATEYIEGEAPLAVRLETDACTMYATALLKLDCSKAGQTPDDAIAFLAAMNSGAKGLAPVDASNELLHRYGHPTHAFDADKLKGDICVRWARDGETLLSLDGVQRILDSRDMVIADDSGPIALAGVIGGEPTKVTESTRRVLLESAFFLPRAVRATARRHGIHTDASHRFGRGADPAFVKNARDLLVGRLISWVGADLVASWTVGKFSTIPSGTVVTHKNICRIAGEAVPLEEVKKILLRLGCQLESTDYELNVCPPTWRHDLLIPEDYAEEVLRVRGYDRINAVIPPLDVAPEPLPNSYLLKRNISSRLSQLGFFQTVTLGFVGPDSDAKFVDEATDGRLLSNPLSVEYSVMRGSLLSSLWEVAKTNQRYGARDIRLFEIAPVYKCGPNGPSETITLGLVWAGALGGDDPLSQPRPVMMADLIGIVRDIGFAGDADVVEFEQGAFGWEISLTGLEEQTEIIIPKYVPFSRYPMVARDLSLLVPLDLSYGELEKSIRRAMASAPLNDVRCTDVYKDSKLSEAGKQAWLIRLRFQSIDRTLTGEEVEAWVALAIDAVAVLGVILRG